MDNGQDSFDAAQAALQQSWEVHRPAFGPILEPAFAENPQVRITLIAALNHISRREIQRGLELLKQIKEFCIYEEDKAAWTFFVGLGRCASRFCLYQSNLLPDHAAPVRSCRKGMGSCTAIPRPARCRRNRCHSLCSHGSKSGSGCPDCTAKADDACLGSTDRGNDAGNFRRNTSRLSKGIT